MTRSRGRRFGSTGAAAIALAGALCALLAMPAQAGDVFKGREVYVRQCQICHGSNGVAQMAGVPDLSRGEGMMQSDPALLSSIKSGLSSMPGYVGILSDRDILDVITYMRTLQR